MELTFNSKSGIQCKRQSLYLNADDDAAANANADADMPMPIFPNSLFNALGPYSLIQKFD